MARRRAGRDVNGILLLDKPAGISSNRALQIVKRLYGANKAGHTGSLDPFATGLLPICFGEATKVSAFMLDADKSYQASAQLGVATTTADTEGEVCETLAVPPLSEADIQAVLTEFTGSQSQIPPMYSALKQDGRKLYELARKGIEVDRPARNITIHQLQLRYWRNPVLGFEVSCSKGTYIRVLAEDIAKSLGTCAHLQQLRRSCVGEFNLDAAVTIDVLESLLKQSAEKDFSELDSLLLPVDSALTGFAQVELTPPQALAIQQGRKIELEELPDLSIAKNEEIFSLYTSGTVMNRYLIGMGRVENGVLRSVRLFPGLYQADT